MLGEELKSSDAWDPPTLTCVSEKVPLGFSGNQLLVLPKSFSLCKAACSSTLSLLLWKLCSVHTCSHSHLSIGSTACTEQVTPTSHKRTDVNLPQTQQLESWFTALKISEQYDKRLIYTPTFLYIEITRYNFDKSLHVDQVLAVHLGNI